MNQTSIFYEFLDDFAYDFKEIKIVWIKQSRNDWKKRCATFMLYVSTNDLMHCKILLIFKNLDKINFIKKEMQKYHKNVVVQWNKKAYCNSEIIMYWLKHMYRLIILDFTQIRFSRLFSLDVFADQKTSEIKQTFKNFNVISLFISSNCIDYVQILDVVINKSFKMMLTNVVEKHYIDNFVKWKKKMYIVNERRTLLIKWIDETWTKLYKKKEQIIRDIFRKLDLFLIVDDFENHEFNVKDINDLQINDWRLFDITTKNVYNAFDSTEQKKKSDEKDDDENSRQYQKRIHSWYERFDNAECE